jgi:dCMP deaminase
MMMEIAHTVAKRSTCFRLNVGAVVVINKRIVSIGYNGRDAGQPHCEGNACPGRFSCKETIHAEDNALRHVPHTLRAEPCDLYVTDSPCPDCMLKILERPVKRLFFDRPYRINNHLDVLPSHNVEVMQVTPAGYIIDWFSKEIIDDRKF